MSRRFFWQKTAGRAAMVALVIGLAATAAGVLYLSRPNPSLEVAEEPPGGDADLPFRLPPGYVAERVAGPPVVTHPMFACLDPEGRLYVAGTLGHDGDKDALANAPPDLIRRLVDTDGDGRYDRSTIFADGLTFPQGVLWHDGALFVASPPSLWRLEDTDGDGIADVRKELVTGFPFTGIADDLHGPSLGPDGRLYWCVGRFDYAIRTPGGPLIRQGRAPLVMRCRPDGGDVEVFSAAMGNPVEVAFSAEGEPFACGTFLAPDAMGPGLRDGIIHCVADGVYPIRDREPGVGDRRTGDPLPPLVQLGVAAGSGLASIRGGRFGGDGRPVLFSALYNTHKIARHVLRREGASYRSEDEDFLVSTDPDFHPSDVLEDADGSLLVVDTGGWFRSCPTSQIDRKDVLGGIYRIRPRSRRPAGGARPTSDPYGKDLEWTEADTPTLVGRLSDPRPAVVDRAMEALASKRVAGVTPMRRLLEGNGPAPPRRSAIWTLSRIDGMAAREAVMTAIADPDPSVRLTAVAATGLRRFANGTPALVERLRDDDLAVRREAATALARIGRPGPVPALLAVLVDQSDPFLQHAAIDALIRIGDRDATLAGLDAPDPLVRRGALIALDGMDGGGLTPELLRPLLASSAPIVQREALRVAAARPEWAGVVVDLIDEWLDRDGLDAECRDSLHRTIVALIETPAVQTLLEARLAAASSSPEARTLLLRAVADAPLKRWPTAWSDPVRRAIGDEDPKVASEAVAVVRARRLSDCDAALLAVARDASRADDLRVDALEAALPRLKALEPADHELLTASLEPDRPAFLRQAAARAIGRSRIDAGRLADLTEKVSQAGALTLPLLLHAFDQADEYGIGLKLVEALERSPGLPALSTADLDQTLGRYPSDVRERARPLYERLTVDEAEMVQRIQSYESDLAMGDPLRGQSVFYSEKATCTVCHSVRSRGGKVGPDLTTIGSIRSGHDLLEAVLYPSASFARGYEPHRVATRDGLVYHGLVVRERPDSVDLLCSDRTSVTIARAEVEEFEPARESVMPRGLEAKLDRQEFLDLISFLRSLK